MKRRSFKHGWVPDVPDGRDFLYAAIRPRFRLAPSVDLRKLCSPVEDQGRLGSCTANALVGILEFLDNHVDAKYEDASRLFIYYNERALQGSVAYDSGASLRIGIKTLAKSGSCNETIWPYDIAEFAVKPPARCYAQAKAHRIVSYHRIDTVQEMLSCLGEGYPFVFGFTVYEGFESPETARTGIVRMPAKSERALGGHAVTAVGYDRKKENFIVRNSWGRKWGKGGYCMMPFEYLETLADDFWTVRR